LLSDLNAYLGIFTQHFGYADLTPQQISSAKPLPTTGDTTTQYYIIPTANLPLLAPVRLIPLIGDPLADLVQPDLAILVNLGYGSITNGWSPGPANVTTPFGFLPTNINLSDLVTALANGAVQGVTNALNDLKNPQLIDLSPLSLFLAGLNTIGDTPSTTPTLLQLLGAFATIGNAGVPVTSSGGILNTLTSVISNDLAVTQPLANSALAIGASLPQYDAQLFTSQLQAGNLLNAIGMPIAADAALGLYTLIFGAVFPVVGAAATTVTQLAQLAGLEPNPAAAGTASTAIAQPALSTNAGANAATAPHNGTNAATGLASLPVATAVDLTVSAAPNSAKPLGGLNTAASTTGPHTAASTGGTQNSVVKTGTTTTNGDTKDGLKIGGTSPASGPAPSAQSRARVGPAAASTAPRAPAHTSRTADRTENRSSTTRHRLLAVGGRLDMVDAVGQLGCSGGACGQSPRLPLPIQGTGSYLLALAGLDDAAPASASAVSGKLLIFKTAVGRSMALLSLSPQTVRKMLRVKSSFAQPIRIESGSRTRPCRTCWCPLAARRRSGTAWSPLPGCPRSSPPRPRRERDTLLRKKDSKTPRDETPRRGGSADRRMAIVLVLGWPITRVPRFGDNSRFPGRPSMRCGNFR
jgi:PE-PPE domain